MNSYAYVLRFWLSKCISGTIMFIELFFVVVCVLSLSLSPQFVCRYVFCADVLCAKEEKNDNSQGSVPSSYEVNFVC